MDVRLSFEQRALRDSAAQIMDKLGVHAVGQLSDTDRTARLDAAIEGTGWRELRIPDADGGPLASAVEACIVAEELANGRADAPFVGPILATELRRLGGIPTAATRETVVLAANLSEVARAMDGRIPPGCLAVDAQGSPSALFLAPVDGGYAVASAPIAHVLPRVDLTREVAALDEQTVVHRPSGQTRPLTDGDLERWTALGLALTAADLVGTMRGALRLGCDYAQQRHQYGSPIGSFQAVQHLLADAFVAMEGARSAALHAAWAVDALAPAEALVSAAVAKAYAARAARATCETVIQVHGGIGNTWECLAHVDLRRALLSSDLLGGSGCNLERVLAHHLGSDDGLR